MSRLFKINISDTIVVFEHGYNLIKYLSKFIFMKFTLNPTSYLKQ